MAGTKVKVNFRGMEKLFKGFFSRSFAEQVSSVVKHHIKRSIAVGKSPVQGVGRFPGYKAVETNKKLRKVKKGGGKISKVGYPYSVQSQFPSKKVRPVNLFLSGKYLSDLDHKISVRKKSLTIGFFRGLSKKKAQTHNEGLHPKVPQRKHLPTGKDERFTASVDRVLKELFAKRLKIVIAKSKRK